jgi:hypothetical protein
MTPLLLTAFLATASGAIFFAWGKYSAKGWIAVVTLLVAVPAILVAALRGREKGSWLVAVGYGIVAAASAACAIVLAGLALIASAGTG